MPSAVMREPFDLEGWLFEVYDGFRALCYLENGNVRLVSRNGNAFKSFPELCSTLPGCIQADNAILDGEIVHLDRDGKPQFWRLMQRRKPQYLILRPSIGS